MDVSGGDRPGVLLQSMLHRSLGHLIEAARQAIGQLDEQLLGGRFERIGVDASLLQAHFQIGIEIGRRPGWQMQAEA